MDISWRYKRCRPASMIGHLRQNYILTSVEKWSDLSEKMGTTKVEFRMRLWRPWSCKLCFVSSMWVLLVLICTGIIGANGKNRAPVVEDLFYPGDPDVLARTVDRYLSTPQLQSLETSNGIAKAVIAPHASVLLFFSTTSPFFPQRIRLQWHDRRHGFILVAADRP